MPLDKEAKKEYQREYMKKKRSNKGSNIDGSNKEGLTLDVTQYPAILHALADIQTRAKLRAICQSLSQHHVLKEVNYGVSGPPMDIVSEYLTALA